MPVLKRAATARPLQTVKSRLHRETSNHSNLDSLLEDISRSQQLKENRCTHAAGTCYANASIVAPTAPATQGLNSVYPSCRAPTSFAGLHNLVASGSNAPFARLSEPQQ